MAKSKTGEFKMDKPYGLTMRGIVKNSNDEILILRRHPKSRTNPHKWELPGGKVDPGEFFDEALVREIKEETNLDVNEEDLELIDIVSGTSRRNDYPNGDVVINNTALYCIRNYSGELKWDTESKEMKFFDLDNLPQNQNDPDLIEIYKKSLSRLKK